MDMQICSLILDNNYQVSFFIFNVLLNRESVCKLYKFSYVHFILPVIVKHISHTLQLKETHIATYVRPVPGQ